MKKGFKERALSVLEKVFERSVAVLQFKELKESIANMTGVTNEYSLKLLQI